MKGVFIFLAEGFEDVEAVATYDALRRGGVNAEFIGVRDEPFVTSSHGTVIGVERTLSDLLDEVSHEGTDRRDFLIFPGGMPGTRNLAACAPLISLMREHYAQGGSLAAICAAPGLVLGQLDASEGLEFTCFDGFETALASQGAAFVRKPAVRCGRIVTGRSAGYAVDFGLEILEAIKGAEVAAQVRGAMLLDIQ